MHTEPTGDRRRALGSYAAHWRHGSLGCARQGRADLQACKLFCQHILQNVLVETETRDQLLELAVLLLELLHAPSLTDANPAAALLQPAERLL
jgi:hypothetical protein